MQLTTVQLWERIHASGLATPEQCRVWARAVSKSAGADALGEPGLLAKELVSLSFLTAYQANVLFRGLAHPVRLGNVNVVRSMDAELGPSWYEGRVDSAPGAEGESVWVVALGAGRLAERELQGWPPSLRWAEAHCRVPADASLLRWTQSGATLQHLYAVAAPTRGGLLSKRLADGPLSAESALRWVRSGAEGLACLHREGLVHGHLSTAASWVEEDGRGGWLRDPLFPPRSPYHGMIPSLLGGQEERLAVAAPELIAPGAIPTVGSDLYALGCLWYRCLVGQWPFDPGPSANVDVWGRLHAQVPVVAPDVLSASVARCLMHLLAKDPAVRFQSAEVFLGVLEKAVASDPTPLREVMRLASALSKPISREAESISPALDAANQAHSHEPSKEFGKGKPARRAAPVESKGKNGGDGQRSGKRAAEPQPARPSVGAMAADRRSSVPANPSPSRVIGMTPESPKVEVKSEGAGSNRPVSVSGGAVRSNPGESQSSAKSQTSPGSQSAPEGLRPVVRILESSTPIGPRPINNPLLLTPKPLPGSPAESAGSEPSGSEPSGEQDVAATPNAVVVEESRSGKGGMDDSNSSAREERVGGDSASPSKGGQPATFEDGREAAVAAAETASIPKAKVQECSNPSRSASASAEAPKAKSKKKRKGKSKRQAPAQAVVASSAIRGKRKVKRPVWFMPLIMGCSALLLAVIAFALSGGVGGGVSIDTSKDRQPQSDSIEGVVSNRGREKRPDVPVVDPMSEYFVVKGDDGKSPWVPPTAGTPYSTEMLPMGLEAVAFLSNRVWAGQGPVQSLLPWWTGIEPEGWDLPEASLVHRELISTIAIAWYPGREPGTYQRAVRLTLREPKLLSEVVKEIDAFESETNIAGNTSGTIWTRASGGSEMALGADGFRAKPDQPIKRIAIGPRELIAGLATQEGRSGPMRRQMDTLLQTTDGRADLTVLAAPSFLFGDGKELFGGHSQRVLSVLRSVVDDNVQAVLFRTHLDPKWYMEWRTLSNDLQSAARDAAGIRKQLEGLPDTIEAQLNQQPADPYWRALANRYPQMLRALAKYVRSASEDGQVVVNAYLPAEGLTNLAIASWMAMQGEGNASGIAAATKPVPAAAITVEQMLDTKISLRIEQESLEVVLQAIATELKDTLPGGKESLPMAINGTAFQKDGITRNQQIRGFAFTDTPVREVLTALCRKANPVTTVQVSNDKDQKVVWILLEDPTTLSKKKLDMTTRAWSDTNQATLPREFALPTP